MKPSKVILALFVAQILCLIFPQAIFCQTEKLDTRLIRNSGSVSYEANKHDPILRAVSCSL